MGVKFGMEEGTEGPLLLAKFHPHRCNVSPLRGEKPQNRPLSKLNTGRFGLRAMLPVITGKPHIENSDAVNWLHNAGILGIRNSEALLSCSQWPTLDHF